MAEAKSFYNKLELTIEESDDRFTQFGRDVDELLQRYQDLIIGYDLEDLDGDVYHCYDEGYERAEPRLREVYGFE
jgi:hypothetical protein